MLSRLFSKGENADDQPKLAILGVTHPPLKTPKKGVSRKGPKIAHKSPLLR
jgi:hypothetical protein